MTSKEQMRQLLLEIYNLDGPRDGNGKIVSPEEFAMMSPDQIDLWDFERRMLMLRIAKAISLTRVYSNELQAING